MARFGGCQALEVWRSQHGPCCLARSEEGLVARACALAQFRACAPLEVQGMCSMGVLQRHGPGLHLQCGHGRAP
ncbi:hypothetical protein JCGZ_09521 [Jatropha curcas]|uniref:Uncharacterized protein n=1 Tax=Jatropha curcas TaxID=180498 RepID=A0A067KJB2_JATCU|nr:hypothetical protein JCGZ_09521 [Jatropha curcas]